jgi:hypothetical protein
MGVQPCRRKGGESSCGAHISFHREMWGARAAHAPPSVWVRDGNHFHQPAWGLGCRDGVPLPCIVFIKDGGSSCWYLSPTPRDPAVLRSAGASRELALSHTTWWFTSCWVCVQGRAGVCPAVPEASSATMNQMGFVTWWLIIHYL